MSSSTLFRLSGLAGMLGGLLVLIGNALPRGPAVNIAGLLAPALSLLVLTGLYLRQREESGILGAIGYIAGSLGFALIIGLAFAARFVLSFLSESVLAELFAGPTRLAFLVISLTFLLGVILFFITVIQAGIFSRVAAVLIIVGTVPLGLQAFPFIPPIAVVIGGVLSGVGVAWLGYELWSGTGEMAGEPEPAT